MKENRVNVNQLELQIREYENEGDAIVFLHFGGSNLMMWQRAIPYFEDRYRLILVDLRGHGKSDRPETGYHMDQMASDVVGVLDHLKLKQAHIVGSSIGAEVGLAMAAHYPERVISLILDGALSSEYGPYGTWEETEGEFEEFIAEQLKIIRITPEAIYSTMEDLVSERREFFEKYGWWNEYLEAVVRYDARKTEDGKYLRGMGKKANKNYMKDYFRYRFEEYYKKVKCPLLMLVEKDLEDGREKAAIWGLKELAENSEIVEINNWAHPYKWFLEPEGACEAILGFLGKNLQKR